MTSDICSRLTELYANTEGHTVTSRPGSIDEGTPSPPVPHTAHALYGLVIQFLAGQSLVHKSGRATAGRESRVLHRRLMWSVMAGGEGRGRERQADRAKACTRDGLKEYGVQ
jgi:hypothetical protein